MFNFPPPLKTILQLVTVMAMVLWASRWIFFIYNYKHFVRIDGIDVVKIFTYGLRFDALHYTPTEPTALCNTT